MKKSKILSPEFLVHWNAGAEQLERYVATDNIDLKLSMVENATLHFMNAKSFCDNASDIQACNQQLFLLCDKKIELHFERIVQRHHLDYAETTTFINQTIEEIQGLLLVSPELSTTWTSFYYNLGTEFYNLIECFKDSASNDYQQIGLVAKQYIELAKSVANNDKEFNSCVQMMMRIDFHMALLLKEDLSKDMNQNQFKTYISWLNNVLKYYVRHRDFEHKKDMMKLVSFAITGIKHALTLDRDFPYEEFKNLLLLVSRSSHLLRDAKDWKAQYDKLDRIINLRLEIVDEEEILTNPQLSSPNLWSIFPVVTQPLSTKSLSNLEELLHSPTRHFLSK